jgi:hypothetical protein
VIAGNRRHLRYFLATKLRLHSQKFVSLISCFVAVLKGFDEKVVSTSSVGGSLLEFCEKFVSKTLAGGCWGSAKSLYQHLRLAVFCKTYPVQIPGLLYIDASVCKILDFSDVVLIN